MRIQKIRYRKSLASNFFSKTKLSANAIDTSNMISELTDPQAVVEQRISQKLDSIPKCNCNQTYKVSNENEGAGK